MNKVPRGDGRGRGRRSEERSSYQPTRMSHLGGGLVVADLLTFESGSEGICRRTAAASVIRQSLECPCAGLLDCYCVIEVVSIKGLFSMMCGMSQLRIDATAASPTQIVISKVQGVGKDYSQNNPQNVTTMGAYNGNGCPLYATLRSFRSEFNLRRRFEFAEYIYCLSNHHKRRKHALFRSDG